ncbi:hypothetical protein CONPUDRAFT_156294 [Coniophora puteana RWD-64-598 SS2]|uniref:Uncharacterized protein n=1 Tax=Coniophora puteana (strain RWD-64-598) TaxID=741705 RepID=A0A5M3MGC9_CONPW|nr:uncharacterized protein CONPUDRAFT_156294 [Coniophora puteana RWD-64-598 SS2]EIW78298.1 hypothetical protein CONPUDRAFT_156294 [Coniophora puteana RWD-64-598 SS2]
MFASQASSTGVYVPVHRRGRSSDSTCSGSDSESYGARSPSPALSATSSTFSAHNFPVYTLSELLALAESPLTKGALDAETLTAMRNAAPSAVLSRRQRKSVEWHTRHPSPSSSDVHNTHHAPPMSSPRSKGVDRSSRRPSHGSASTSSSDDERSGRSTWRRVPAPGRVL